MDDPPPSEPTGDPEEEPTTPPEAGWRKGLAWTSRIAMVLGGGTLAVTGVLWIGMLAGWVPEFPYLTIALGAAAVYYLGRLPAYIRFLLPKPEDRRATHHRRDD